MRSPIVLGSGLCASAAASALRRAVVLSPLGRRPHTRVDSEWRTPAVVTNLGSGGLSQYYHGVMPAAVLTDEKNQPGLRLLGLADMTVPQGDWNFVATKVPRPWVRPDASIDGFDLGQVGDTPVFMCLSVIGNLQLLVAEGYLKEARVSDDVVFKLGTVSLEEGARLLPPLQRGPRGTFHPILRFPGGQVGLRPKFFRDTTINFIDPRQNFLSIDPRDLAEKSLRALYLRYGLYPLKASGWDVYVQRSFPHAYTVSRDGVAESRDLKSLFEAVVEEEIERMMQIGFTTFRHILGDVMSGIHLGYDRNLLNVLPPRFHVLDTSLNPEPGQHSTVRTFCIAHALASSVDHD
jgi:hypothetical protein